MENKLNRVDLVFHDPSWKETYKTEKEIILSVINKNVVSIEHVGSTSVPNINSKPIIDIVIGLESLIECESYIAMLVDIGYVFKGHMGKSNRYYFYKLVNEIEMFHLHVVEYCDQNWYNLVLFRDILLNNKQIRIKYNELKANLEKKHYKDRKTYTSLKSDFIIEVLGNDSI